MGTQSSNEKENVANSNTYEKQNNTQNKMANAPFSMKIDRTSDSESETENETKSECVKGITMLANKKESINSPSSDELHDEEPGTETDPKKKTRKASASNRDESSTTSPSSPSKSSSGKGYILREDPEYSNYFQMVSSFSQNALSGFLFSHLFTR